MYRIGYIDDQPVQYNNFRKKIQRRFPDVDLILLDQCTTREEFLKRIYEEKVDVLLIDYKMASSYGFNGSALINYINDQMHERFHIDHFTPVKIAPERKEDYYNLVLACPKCNLVKSGKWPTEDKNIMHDEEKGFIDPATEEYDKHIVRTEEGFIQGKTVLGRNMCKNLNFHIRRTDLYWKIHILYQIQEKLEQLYDEKKLEEEEKNFYIESNRLLKCYIKEAFAKGE